MSGGCNDSPLEQIQRLYTELARHPEGDFGWAKGKESARQLGYDARWLDGLPEAVWESCAAVGDPFSLGAIHAGEHVVDLGCGAGADACVAAMLAGPAGRVTGVDCTPAMVEKARRNARAAGLDRTVFLEADMTRLPLPDGAADVLISNGAINLCTDKRAVLAEAFRVLRPGGRLQVADMVRETGADLSCGGGSWADCVSGTLEPSAFLDLLGSAGFQGAEITGYTEYRTAAHTVGVLVRARRPD